MAFNLLHGPGHHDFQAEINDHLYAVGLPLRCGRRVETNGHCFYDTALATFDEGIMRASLPDRASLIFTVQYFRKRLAFFIKTNKQLQNNPTFKAYKTAVLLERENKHLNGNFDRYPVGSS